jgi:hypothetical protein
VPDYARSDPAVLTFIVIPVVLGVLFTWAVTYVYARPAVGRKRVPAARMARLTALAVAAWMMITWRVAGSGVLRQWERTPPPVMVMVVAIVAVAAAIVLTPLGRRLAWGIPLWVLVGVQGFRLPLELAMHRLVDLGIMPPQMTYTGRNYDIVTGATAIGVALLLRAGVAGRRLARAWNILGLALLANIVVVAILSTPVFRYFGDQQLNVFVTYTPFVWLPTVMVLAALAGHLLIFRALTAPHDTSR